MRFYKHKYDDTKMCRVSAMAKKPPLSCTALEYNKGFAGLYRFIESHDELFSFLSSYEEVEKKEFLKLRNALIKIELNR